MKKQLCPWNAQDDNEIFLVLKKNRFIFSSSKKDTPADKEEIQALLLSEKERVGCQGCKRKHEILPLEFLAVYHACRENRIPFSSLVDAAHD